MICFKYSPCWYEPGSFPGVEDRRLRNVVFITEAHCVHGDTGCDGSAWDRNCLKFKEQGRSVALTTEESGGQLWAPMEPRAQQRLALSLTPCPQHVIPCGKWLPHKHLQRISVSFPITLAGG